MIKLIIRILLALCISVGLSTVGIKGDVEILQTLFTILGIVFSIVMSLLVTFDLSEIRNTKIRKRIRASIAVTMRNFVADFVLAAFVFIVVSVIFKNANPITLEWATIDIHLAGMLTTIISLGYEVYNFGKIHKLKVDIEEQILSEKQ